MNVDETDRFPALAAEVRSGPAKEIGFDVFDLPPGATPLSPEADYASVEARPAVPEMVDEVPAAVGEKAVAALPDRAEALEAGLIRRTTPGFEAFAARVAAA